VESGAQSSVEQSESFEEYGTKLAALAKLGAGRPTLLINWPYDPSIFADYDQYDRAEHLDFLRSTHSDLADGADLDRVDVASVWEAVRISHPEIKLTTDGNHPTVAGSYLHAVALYRNLTSGPVTKVGYVPDGLSSRDAAVLREAVAASPVLTR
jgi:hypothetical protein